MQLLIAPRFLNGFASLTDGNICLGFAGRQSSVLTSWHLAAPCWYFCLSVSFLKVSDSAASSEQEKKCTLQRCLSWKPQTSQATADTSSFLQFQCTRKKLASGLFLWHIDKTSDHWQADVLVWYTLYTLWGSIGLPDRAFLIFQLFVTSRTSFPW